MERKLPIAYQVLVEREGTCPKCQHKAQFKNWAKGFLGFFCTKCRFFLDAQGAVRKSTWEWSDF